MEKKTIQEINNYFKKIKYKFTDKPLVVGGMALQYHDVRKSGKDIDLIVSARDWNKLEKLYPDKVHKFLFGKSEDDGYDATITLKNGNHIDLIKSLWGYNYSDLSKNSIVYPKFKIAALEKILFIKTFPAIYNKDARNMKDLDRIIKHMRKKQLEKYKN